MYMDNIKLFEKNEKAVGNSDTLHENIQSGPRERTCHGKMCYACKEKQETTPYGMNETTKSRQD